MVSFYGKNFSTYFNEFGNIFITSTYFNEFGNIFITKTLLTLIILCKQLIYSIKFKKIKLSKYCFNYNCFYYFK
jgi:hypothetical protein